MSHDPIVNVFNAEPGEKCQRARCDRPAEDHVVTARGAKETDRVLCADHFADFMSTAHKGL